MSLFEQYPLFAPDLSTPGADTAGAPAKKARTYDLPVLKWVAFHRVATVHQVVYRFFVYAGRGPGYGFRIIQGLVERGLLLSAPLDTDKGSVSRHVLSLSDAGWHALGESVPKDKKRLGIESLKDYRLQFAEMMLVRELEGWSLVPATGVWSKLAAWAVEQYKNRPLTDTERAMRSSLEKTEDVHVGLNALWSRKTGQVRLLLPVRRGLSYTRLIERLPRLLAAVPDLEFELVVADLAQAEAAKAAVERWASRLKIDIVIHQSDNFRSRAHPADAKEQIADLYFRNGIPDPRVLL